MKAVVDGVFTFTGLPVGRVYLLASNDGWTLIDASVGIAAGSILKQLAQAGHAPTDIKRILITHAHPDHVGGLAAIKKATGSPVFIGADDNDEFVMRSGLKPDGTLGEGDVLPEVLGGLQVLHTPGHSLGHLSFWQPDRGILFCGDVIMALITYTLPIPFFTVNMTLNKQSIQRIVALQPKVVCFGHGAPLLENATPALMAFARRHPPQ